MQDKLFRDTFTAFDTKRDTAKGLPKPLVKEDIPGQVGVGRDPTAKKSGASSGDGVGGDLQEQSRTYYDVTSITSSDGLFTINVHPVKTVTMMDAKGATATWTFNRT